MKWILQTRHLLLLLIISGTVYSMTPKTFTPVEKCGIAPLDMEVVDKRIIMGSNVRQHSHPWIVRLVMRDSGELLCGGTLISSRFVLTAAHCVVDRDSNSLKLILGDHDQYIDNEANHVERDIENIVIHPNFSSITADSDIALLIIHPVRFQDHIQPACFPPSANYKDPPAASAWAVGWGRTNESDKVYPAILKEAKLPMLSSEECKYQTLHGQERISENMLCAGNHHVDSCQGDSGGPLMVRKSSRWEIHGIVSWGRGCARPNYPGIYVKVINYIDWIKNEMSLHYSRVFFPFG